MTIDPVQLRRLVQASHQTYVGGTHPVPCYLDASGRPVVALTTTANALTLRLPLGAAGAELLLSGKAVTLDAAQQATPRHARYAAALAMADEVCRLEVRHCKVAAPPAAPLVFDYAALALAIDFPDGAEERMVQHMNADHTDSLRVYCAHAGVAAALRDPHMLGVDHDGFDVLADDGIVRFTFEQRCATPLEVRTALVALAGRARGAAAAHS